MRRMSKKYRRGSAGRRRRSFKRGKTSFSRRRKTRGLRIGYRM